MRGLLLDGHHRPAGGSRGLLGGASGAERLSEAAVSVGLMLVGSTDAEACGGQRRAAVGETLVAAYVVSRRRCGQSVVALLSLQQHVAECILHSHRG